jgi:DNA polymerase
LCDLTKEQGKEFFLDHKLNEHAILAHNTRFDGAILNWYYDVTPLGYFDTMLMARATLRHLTGSVSLSALAEVLQVGHKGTEVVSALGKHREDFTDEEWNAYREYCQLDVALTHAIFCLIAPDVPPREFKAMNQTLRWYIEPVLKLDLPMLQDAVINEQADMDYQLKSSGLTMDLLASNKKFPEWLESMNVEVPLKPSPSNPAKMIPAIAKADPQFQALTKHPNPTVAAACTARLRAKSRIKETRMQRFVGIGQRNDGKLPVPLLYCGAHTHRYAGDEAINLQNLTTGDALRDSIQAPAGHSLMSADQGQIEARLNACLAGQLDLVEGFRRGEDVYSDMAQTLYGVPVSQETEPLKRKTGKAIILGAGYGMGGERCYDFLTGQWAIEGITKEFAQQCVNAYRTKMWAIAENWKTVNRLLGVMAGGGEEQYGPVVFRHEEVLLPSGMSLRYPGLHHDGSNYQYKRYNRTRRKWDWVKIYGAMMVENLCQALARELLTEQMLILDKRWRTVHQIHDEIIFVVPNNEVDLACKVMKKIMEIPPEWMPELPLKVEPSWGKTLGDCK